jgi:hypothetical protein
LSGGNIDINDRKKERKEGKMKKETDKGEQKEKHSNSIRRPR